MKAAASSKAGYSVSEYIMVFALSILISNAKILDIFTPFGVCLTAVLPNSLSFIALAGSFVGYSIFGGIEQNMLYIVAAFGVIGFKLVFRSYKKLNQNKFIMAFTVFFTIGLISSLYYVISGDTLTSILLGLCESALGGAVALFFGFCASAFHNTKNIRHYSMIEKVSLVIMGVIIFVSLASVEVSDFNLARILGIFIIIFCIYKIGIVGGAISSIILTIALSLYDISFALSTGVLIISAFLAGLFVPLGKIGIVTAFICINTFIILIMDGNTTLWYQMMDLLLASAIFMFIPERFLQRMATVNPIAVKTSDSIELKNGLSSKLEFTSKTLEDLEESVTDISKKMEHISSNGILDVMSRCSEKVCKDCGFHRFCWVTAYAEMKEAWSQNIHTLQKKGKLDNHNIASFFKQKCCKLDEFISTANRYYKEYLAQNQASRRVTEARKVAIEQFNGLAYMLSEISSDLTEIVEYDEISTQKVIEVFSNYGYIVQQVFCITDKFGRLGIEIYINRVITSDMKGICSTLSSVLERELELPSVITVDGFTKISFFERANYVIDFAGAQLAEEGNKICGDSYEYFVDSKGFAHVILSDGMGSGGRAAIDSVMTCSLFLKLMKAGFGFQATIKLINSSFLVRSQDESLATIDALQIDMYTGEAHFFKAGAVQSFVLKNDSTFTVSSNSLPIGILQNTNYDQKRVKLARGDIVLMVSDGVIHSGSNDWIKAELELLKDKPAKIIARKIAGEAKKRRLDDHSDDITALVIKMQKGA